MKHFLLVLAALASIAVALPATAQPGDSDREEARDPRSSDPRWSRGERLPDRYREDPYRVPDWRARNLPPPPRGYRWVCDRRHNCFLVANRSLVIRRTMWRDDREYWWRERYRSSYTYGDDLYYRECRERPDPAGVLIGGLIGGLLGRAISDDDSAGATFAGVIVGGALGAALTRDLDCDDRNYAYYAYYHAFNGGRPGVIYRWSNPRTRHHGRFWVRRYYYDSYGFHCADYSHQIYIPHRRTWRGHACRQPDGAWVFLR